MRSLVAEQPEASALHFALGNRLAAERRWSEAQASYFKEHDLDRGNPDYLFNLAVSLDHMGQAALAARFYTESLAAARTRSSSFQAEAVQARLAALATR